MKPTYQDLRRQPIKIEVNAKPQEVVFKTVASMCNNRHEILFKKKEDGSYYVSAGRQALSNFSGENDFERSLKWAAADGNWREVARHIRNGYQEIEAVKVLGEYNKTVSLFEQVSDLEHIIHQRIRNGIKGRELDVHDFDILIDDIEIVKICRIRNKLVPHDEQDNQYDIENIALSDLARIADFL